MFWLFSHQHPYYRGDLGLISEKTCNETARRCRNHILELATDFHDALDGLTLVATEISKAHPGNDGFAPTIKQMISEITKLESGKLQVIVKNILASKVERNKAALENEYKKICEQTITLHRTPIMLEYYPVFEKIAKTIVEKLKQLHGTRSLMKTSSNWESSSFKLEVLQKDRKLFKLLQLPGFKQEVLVLSFSELQVVRLRAETPMNTSLLFP